MSSQEYYNSPDEWGNYQYITLEDVINNYMMSQDADDYTSTIQRYKVLYQARRGLRELYYDVLREIKAIEIELPPTLMITLPPDFVNYVRISWLDDNGELHPMAVDDKISIASTYLQDHEYNLLFDNDGCVLQDNSTPEPVQEGSSGSSTQEASCYRFHQRSFTPSANLSNVYPNGKFRLDKNRGIIAFDSSAFSSNIVLEYISDGLYTGCEGKPEAQIRVHKFAESAILDYIYYELIKKRRNVPFNEKRRARDEFYNSRRIAKRRINTLRRSEVIQAFRGSTKWIKGE